MICSKTVFRCFKCLEHLADRITGAAGPYFVALAILLIGSGAVSFFDVIFPELSIIPKLLCLQIVVNLVGHYWWACTSPPGFAEEPPTSEGTSWYWAKRKRHSVPVHITPASTAKCRKCGCSKPERTHHCRVCNRCVLKYDHHCPWINQCVGLHNERHFFLFLAYLFVGTVAFAILGWERISECLALVSFIKWKYRSPQVIFILAYILSFVMALAIGVMGGYHLSLVMAGETSVEAHDNLYYTKVARQRGDTFVNSYNISKRSNLELFFNVGPSGQYPIYTLLLPFRIQPYTDGRSWARKSGYDRHRGVRNGEELTDDEDEGEDVHGLLIEINPRSTLH